MGYLAKTNSKNFYWWEMDLKIGTNQSKVKISCCPNIGMWGVYPEAMAWNVGTVHSDFNMSEHAWRSSPKRANLEVHFEICPFGATSPDMLTQIEIGVHSTNSRPLPLDRHLGCLCLGDVKFYTF